MNIAAYSVRGSVVNGVAQPVRILTAGADATVVKCLELVCGATAGDVRIYRTDAGGAAYGEYRVNMASYSYQIAWQGFFAIPAGHSLYMKATSTDIEAIASVVEI